MEQPPHRPETEDQLGTEARIQRGIAEAFADGRAIDDATARRVANQLHDRQAGALHYLASCGGLVDGLEAEITNATGALPVRYESWGEALLDYCAARGTNRAAQETWAESTSDNPTEAATSAVKADEQRPLRSVPQANAPPEERPAQLGQAEAGTSARWLTPVSGTSEAPADADAELPPAEPPRILLTDAASHADADEPPQAIWLDAAVERAELEQIVRELLGTPPGGTGPVAYRITATHGFHGFEISESEDLGTVARVARGIARHGRVFVAYLDYIGETTTDAVDQFITYYAGTYRNVAAWAETVATELGWFTELDERLNHVLRDYLRIDFERFGRDLTYESHVVEDEEAGQIYVFRLHP